MRHLVAAHGSPHIHFPLVLLPPLYQGLRRGLGPAHAAARFSIAVWLAKVLGSCQGNSR